ncbi:hypothetical protein JOB18_035367 [Solea senegalensis]|uniref:PDZ domain-containing protein n=1 Tax=Solea senegalensis TaxID=28829 RepID=A0AAV6PTR9_SOLSE|nr:uncharacterized protein si:dkey-92i15.4 [Solea senegalensis]XP_043889395.1 uncharacterized protein si:dkey-92i15.4 [Solea senegalensis]KAG7475663.1 hypothetical protein JOB18_035367 [Solea senegalensis]KAG7475664.1 hypothetical protein JOB18_035367 [Solea senegalensis]
MEVSFLPTPENECNRRTEARFTVRSASSPSYGLSRKPGFRRQRGFSEEEKMGDEEVGQKETYGTNSGAHFTNMENGITRYQASNVRGQHEMKATSDQGMSLKLKQNGTGDRMTTEPNRGENSAFISRGRTEWRRSNVTSRSKSLDWRREDRSPVRSRRTDILPTTRGGGMNTLAGGLDDRRMGAETVRSRMSSMQVYNSAGRTNAVQEKSPVSPLNQTLDRVSRGHSLPSRLKSQSLTETSFGPTGGQSILERIEKLYGSAGFSKAEDYNKFREYPTTATESITSSKWRSFEGGGGGTFPRRFSAGEKNSLSPIQSIKSYSWTPPKDTSNTESLLSPGRSRRLSGGLWQGKVQSRYSEESAVTWEGKGLVDIGTRSLDRARSRNTVAAQIRSARAAGGIRATPDTNCVLEEETVPFKESFDFKANKSVDQGTVNYGKEEIETNRPKETDSGTKEKSEMKSDIPDDVFDSNPSKITLKAIEKKNLSEVSSLASVRNKINQFEALSQRSAGQLQVPRRAFSVPTQHIRTHDGVKKSGSAKAIGGLRDKWEGEGEGGEEKVLGAGKKYLLERFISEDVVGLRREESKGNDLAVNGRKEKDCAENQSEDFGKYSRLKSTLRIPLNIGAQTNRRNIYIDETDFSKVSSPEEAGEKHKKASDTTSLLQPDSSANSSSVQKPILTSPVADDDDKTPTNTPNRSPFLSPATHPENSFPMADICDSSSGSTQSAQTPDSPTLSPPLASSSIVNLPDFISPADSTAHQKGKKQALDLDAWVAGLNSAIKVWNAKDDYEDDDDESTQKDEDSNYDSDSGESSVTITSNMSQSDRRSFSVSLSDLYNFAGVDYESENDSDEWQPSGRRSASLSSDVSALSYVSVLPNEELDKLLEDVRNLGDNSQQDYDAVQVVVLHKEMGVGLGFSVAGGVDQNKPVTVHKVFHSGVAAQEGSIRQGDQVLSINGTALSGHAHWEVLRVLRRAKTREMGVVVLRRGDISDVSKSGVQTSIQGSTQTHVAEAGEDMCVRLEKNDRDLGFSLEGGLGSSLGNRPLTVQRVFQGGPLDKVCPGDEILEIEGMSMVGMRRLEAWTLIRKLPPGPVDVVLRRPLKHLETKALCQQ